jgi:hypothetical protein
MTDDVVTAREVAAPATVTLPPQDAQLICDKLDEALAKESYRLTAYSKPIRSLFQLAWAVASHKRNTQVTVYHLAYALVCGHLEDGKELAGCLGSDVESFAVGCILRLLTLGLSTGDKDIVPPSVDAVRWLGEGVALALKRGKQTELQPKDLVRAVQEGTIRPSVRAQLRAAARLGAARRDAILGPRSVQSNFAAPSSSSEIIKQMEEVEKGRAAAGPTDDLTNLVELLEEFEQRHTDVMSKLEKIDRRLEELPRTPSGARLAAAIVAVLILGVAAGLALRFSQVGSLLAQVFSAS